MPLKRTPFKTKQKPLNRTSTFKQSFQSLQCSKSGLKRSGKLKVKKKTDEEKLAQKEQQENDKVFYDQLWQVRGPYSEISNIYLGSETNKACIHHIVPKSVWKEGRYVTSNCILMTVDEHASVENDPTKYPEVNRRREKIKEKYNL